MGHHINPQGQFQSDKYPHLGPDKLVMSFKDPSARAVLYVYAELTEDAELAYDILERLDSIGSEIEGNFSRADQHKRKK